LQNRFVRGPGAGFSGPPIQSDPTYPSYTSSRQQAMDANAWMGVVALAPAAVVLGLETGAVVASARLCNCFVEGTEVQTPDGFRMIEDVEVGDLVLARDEDTGESAYKPVVALIAGSEREIWEVIVETTDGQNVVRQEPIGTTDEHPWRTADGRWVETKDLAPGMELVSSNGDRAVVISAFKTDRIETTYNFEVEGLHTYFVGEAGVWVHNACPPLKVFHSLSAMNSRMAILSRQYWAKQSTDSIVRSLAPGSVEPLTVRANGVIMQGNQRISVLLGRGYPVNSLPRTPY